jgi:hypothetical protein
MCVKIQLFQYSEEGRFIMGWWELDKARYEVA